MAEIQLEIQLTLLEFSRAAHLSEDEVRAWVVEGVLEPAGDRPEEWRFESASLRRARTARRLSRDLGLDATGIALALQLLNEIEGLKTRLARIDTGNHDRIITTE